MDDSIVSALVNVPFAALLAYWIRLDFIQRGENMRTMQKMVSMFTSTMKECCGTNIGVNHRSDEQGEAQGIDAL